MKRTLCSVITSLCLVGISSQAQTPASAATASSLPSYAVGAGPSWTRGGSSQYSFDTVVGVHIGQTQWYSWTDIATPVSFPVVKGGPPAVSTITTGGAWIPIQSSAGAVSLIFIIQTGFSAIQATSTVSPAFTGSIAAAFRLGKSHLYVMPFAKASNATTSSTSGALATAVFQPGIQIVYGFSK
jgi:hypothetical protein